MNGRSIMPAVRAAASGGSDAARAVVMRALCARLRGESVAVSPAMLDAAREHRVHMLLARELSASELAAAGMSAAEQRDAAVLDAWRQRALREVIDGLAAAGAAPLVLKGAALAYSRYAAGFLRPRSDVDLLVARAHVDRAERWLLDSGWQRAIEPDAALTSAQRHYSRTSDHGLVEHVDLHWKISNAQLFADAAGVDELRARSVPLPALGSNGRALAPADALFVACLHRVAHHFDAGTLIWLWDIHLLVSALTPAEARQLVALAARSRMRAVCARGVSLAAEYFHTAGAAALTAALESGGPHDEPSTAFMHGRRIVDVVLSDIRHAGRWTTRARLLGEHLFPPRAYMAARYPGCPRPLLTAAYLYRIVRGAPAWFTR